MNTLAIPRLRDDVVVRPFDDGGASPRFVVAVDGHHFVVTPAIAALLDETKNTAASDGGMESLARRVSHRVGTAISPHQIETLLRERIPKALFAPASGLHVFEGPLLCRRLLLSGATLRPVLALAAKLFAAPTTIALCAAAAAVDLLVGLQVAAHGIASPTALDSMFGLAITLCGILIHELGHLAACHRYGGPHGGIGLGLYWCLPAFYAEVHGAWLLPRKQRAAVDAGGVYLQFLFVAVLGVFHLASPAPALISAIVLSHLLMLHTMNPVLKFDGYWLLCDLAGVHNLHRRVRTIARSMLHRVCMRKGAVTPARAEVALFVSFTVIAALYFAYLLALLGRNLGSIAASFLSATLVSDHSISELAAVLGKGALLALLLAMAIGVAVLLAKAAGAVIMESRDGA